MLHNAEDTVLGNVFVNFAQTAMKIPHYFGQPLDRHYAQLVYREF